MEGTTRKKGGIIDWINVLMNE